LIAIFASIFEILVLIFGVNVAYDAAVLFHGYNIAGNIAQAAVDSGVSQVSAYQAINGTTNYVGNYAVRKAENALPSGSNTISGNCYAISNNSALACTVTYKVSLPIMTSVTGISVDVSQTVVSNPVVA
jgi:hypothetical protein